MRKAGWPDARQFRPSRTTLSRCFITAASERCAERQTRKESQTGKRSGVLDMKPRSSKTCTFAVVLLGLDALVSSGRGMAQGIDPAELVRDLHAIFGEHHARAVHAKGLVLNATFEPTEQARQAQQSERFRRPSFKQRCVFRIRQAYPRFLMPTHNASPHGLAVKFQARQWLRDGFGYAQLQWLSRRYGRRVRQLSQGCRGERARSSQSPPRLRSTCKRHPKRRAFRHAAESAAGKLRDDRLFRRQCICVRRCLRQEDHTAISNLVPGSG